MRYLIFAFACSTMGLYGAYTAQATFVVSKFNITNTAVLSLIENIVSIAVQLVILPVLLRFFSEIAVCSLMSLACSAGMAFCGLAWTFPLFCISQAVSNLGDGIYPLSK